MTPFPAISQLVDASGRLTPAGMAWIRDLIAELDRLRERIAALEP